MRLDSLLWRIPRRTSTKRLLPPKKSLRRFEIPINCVLPSVLFKGSFLCTSHALLPWFYYSRCGNFKTGPRVVVVLLFHFVRPFIKSFEGEWTWFRSAGGSKSAKR